MAAHFPPYTKTSQEPTGAYRAPPEISEVEAQLRTAKASLRYAVECVDKSLAAYISDRQDKSPPPPPKWSPDWAKPRNDTLPPNLASAVTAPNCDGNNGSRIATAAEVDALRAVLSAEELKGFGIVGVYALGVGQPNTGNPHPMAAAALQDADEFKRGDGSTGV